jgi:hypothetical protein
MRTIAATIAALTTLAVLQVAPASADAGSANIELLQNIPHTSEGGGGGSDLEFTDLVVGEGEEARTITVGALGVYRTGLHLYDVTDPTAVQLLGVYECNITQGDVQIFTRADQPGRTFATYTSDTVGVDSPCYAEAEALGAYEGGSRFGTFVVDITDPTDPTTVTFVPHAQGSHNMTVHPSGMYLYNSNSDLITSTSPAIEITDISDLSDPAADLPRTELSLPVRPGLGTESHDITFDAAGDRAYSAALSQTVIIDTTDPMAPTVVTSIVDPMINVEHQANPVTIDDPVYGEHEFLIIEDEFAGAAGGDPCPSGGVHVYDIQDETMPVKVGYWNIGDVRYPGADTADGEPLARCTAHVFEIHEDEALMTMAFYNGGVRVIDISGLVGVALGDTSVAGMREVAFYRAAQADTWAVKAPWVDRDGEFFIFGNDQNRGLDVYRVDLSVPAASGTDVWLDAATAAATLPQTEVRAEYTPYCLLDAAGGVPAVGVVGKALLR